MPNSFNDISKLLLCCFIFWQSSNFDKFAVDNPTLNVSPLNLYYHNKNFEVVSLDVRDPEIKRYVKKNDIIIPLAALVGASLCDYKKDETIQVNFESIKTIVDNLSKDQIILYPTTNSGYGIGQGDKHCTEDTPLNPISLYGKTKIRAEKYVEKHQNSARFRSVSYTHLTLPTNREV